MPWNMSIGHGKRTNMIKQELYEKIKIRLTYTSVLETEDILNDLSERGFFSAPASTRHHGNYVGGLAEHSLAVCDYLLDLTRYNNLKWERRDSPVIVGLFHDLCKLDSYNRKVESESQFTGPLYGYNENTLFTGHGMKSAVIAGSLLKLTEEELACIVYHMGAFTESAEWKNYTGAIKRYPNVLWTHQADMLATHVKGV